MGFFDDFPRFYRTSETSPLPDRLNARYEAIVARNRDRFVGKRVLDIASHDGRWTFAALNAGATHAIGIEPRQTLIDEARETLRGYGIAESAYEFRTADVMAAMDGIAVDTVLCLGFYYHTIRHAELLDKIERTGARFVVIDTEITPPRDETPYAASDDPRYVYGNPYTLQLIRDPVADQRMAYEDALTRNGHTLVARPSRAAIRFMAEHFGFEVREFDWSAYFREHPSHATSMVDYHEGWRSTFYLERG